MKPLSRVDAALAENVDIVKTPDDETSRRGHAVANAVNELIKGFGEVRQDAEKPKEEEGEARKIPDADAGEKIDKILECLDGMNKRFDALSSRMDAYESKQDGAEAAAVMTDKKKRKDAEEEEEKEKGEPRELKADKKADAYMDAYDTDESRDLISEIQAKADKIFSAFGDSAPRPMQNESPHGYERRVATRLKSHSETWKDKNLRELSPDILRTVAAPQIYKDAWAVATSNDHPGIEDGMLREVRRVNRDTGHVIKEYYGQPMSWMRQFTGGRRLAKFNLSKIRNGE